MIESALETLVSVDLLAFVVELGWEVEEAVEELDVVDALGFLFTGIAPEDSKIQRVTGCLKAVDFAQNDTWRR